MEKDLPRKKFIINSLFTSGFSIIAGSPKVGKSWLVLDWCLRIAKGEDVWNLQTNSGTTLYLSLGDDESRLQDRLTAITDEVPSNVHFVTDCSKLDENFEEQIRTFVDEHNDTVLIIIDTFQLIRSANKDLSYPTANKNQNLGEFTAERKTAFASSFSISACDLQGR